MNITKLIIDTDHSYKAYSEGEWTSFCLIDCGLFMTSERAMNMHDRIDGMQNLRDCNLDQLTELHISYGTVSIMKVVKMVVSILREKLQNCSTITKCKIKYDLISDLNLDLRSVEELEIRWTSPKTKIVSIPHSLRSLDKLQSLSLVCRGADNVTLSSTNYKYPSLTKLYSHRIRIPKGLLKSSEQLTDLSLSSVQSILPEIYTVSTLTKLSFFDIKSSKTLLMEKWESLSNLEELRIRTVGDVILELPESLSTLTNLKKLTVSKIGLELLPEYLNTYPTLEYLDVSDNRLDDLVDMPATLTALRASGNQFTSCPSVLLNPNLHIDIVDISCPSLSLTEEQILSLLSRSKSLSIQGNNTVDIDSMICRSDYRVLRV